MFIYGLDLIQTISELVQILEEIVVVWLFNYFRMAGGGANHKKTNIFTFSPGISLS